MNKRIIFLRGLTRAAYHWGDFPEIFRKAHPNDEVEFLEIPGNGLLNDVLTPLDPWEVIVALKNQSLFVKDSTPFHLCGISLGGMIALKWAELFPDRVESVTIINCSLEQYSSFYERLNPNLYFTIVKMLFSKSVLQKEQVILDMTSNKTEIRSRYLERFVNFSKIHKIKRMNFLRQLILARRIRINSLKVPLIVICSEGDRLCSCQCSRLISEKLNGKMSIHPSAGHDLPLDEPEWLAGLF